MESQSSPSKVIKMILNYFSDNGRLLWILICFRDLYELLDSPVLQNEDPDCAFFAWEKMGDEFFNVQSVFDMPEKRITFAEKNYNENINDVHQQNEERVK